jgi:hypothetical protein
MNGGVLMPDPVANAADTSWNIAPAPLGVHPERFKVNLIFPTLDSYFASRWPAAGTYTTDGNGHYDLDTGGAPYAYFKGPDQDLNYNVYSPATQANPSITVSGVAVWLVDGLKGMRFEHRVTVGGNGALIIVARSDQHLEGTESMSFVEGLSSSSVPIILVSEGIVGIGNGSLATSMTINDLSIFADRVFSLTAPDNSTGQTMTIAHTGTLDALLDQFYAWNLLPNQPAGSNPLAFVPGSWQVISASSN